MPRTIQRCLTPALLMLALIGLAACGGATAERDTGASLASPSPSAPASSAPTPASSASAAAAGSAAPSPSASARAAAATSTPASSASAAPAEGYAAIQQSQTAEGYYMLGDPAAPVVLTHYSDFL